MAEMYCKYCLKAIGSEPHSVGGPDCVPLSNLTGERDKQAKKYDRSDLVRRGLSSKKTLD